jgi:hypothetical protein
MTDCITNGDNAMQTKQQVYRDFNRLVKGSLRSISQLVPSISSHLEIALLLIKVSKRVSIKFPFKYYMELVYTPFEQQLVAQDTSFFASDDFEVKGYPDISRSIRELVPSVPPDVINHCWKLVSAINGATDDVLRYKAQKM